jgi:membrane protease YdiL (CAAX protease family)
VTERRPNGRPEHHLESPDGPDAAASGQATSELPTPDSTAAEVAPAADIATAGGRPAGPFTLEHRPVPALYFVAWMLSLAGVALIFIGLLAGSRTWTPPLVLGGFLSFGLGLTAGAGYQLVARRARPAGAYHGPSPLILFGIVVALSQVAVGPFVVAGLIGETTTGVFIGALAIAASYIGTVTLLVVRTGALRWRDMRWPDASGFDPARVLRDVALAVAVMPVAILTAGILGSIVAALLGVRLQSPLPDPKNAIDTVALVLTAVVVAPFGEELFFRGFALTAWQRDLGPRTALVRSSVFFAGAHLINLTAGSAGEGVSIALVTFFVYLPLGVLLGLLFQRGGIVAAIAGHAAANGTVVLLSLLLAPPGA